MFHLDQQPADSNPWPDQSSEPKTVENSSGHAALNSHLTPLTDVPDDDEDEEDNATDPSQKESDDKRLADALLHSPRNPIPTPAKLDKLKDIPLPVDPSLPLPLPHPLPHPSLNGSSPAPDHHHPAILPPNLPPDPKLSTANSISRPPSSTRTNSPSKSDPSLLNPPTGQDPRVSVLLDINAELLRIYIEFQSRNLQHSPECQAYSSRLQSNLNWLMGSMEKPPNFQGIPTVPPLPTMDAPPAVDFADVDKFNKLYSQLPDLFARDVERQNRLRLKRERAPDDTGPSARKRQDLGDTKSSTPPHPSSQRQIQPAANGPVQQSPPPPSDSAHLNLTPGPSTEIPSTPQIPRIAQSATDLQRHPQLQRQMSQNPTAPPLQGAPPGSQSGSSSPPHLTEIQPKPPLNPVHTYSQPPLNPAFASQVMQMLQDPANQQLIKYLMARDPQFASRPPLHQFQQLQLLQQNLRRQQQARLSAQPQFAAGMQQPPVVPSGQPRSIPTNVHPQAVGFPPHMQPPGGVPNPSYANGSGHSMQPPASTSRPGSSHPGLVASNLQAMTPHQRQLALMQQQQRMGGINASQMPNLQGYPFQQQAPHHGSPTGFQESSNDQQMIPGAPIPGPSVPGIAKSSRSPSVPVPSPVKGQGTYAPEAYTQAMMMSTGQPPLSQQSQLSQMALQQGQHNIQQFPNPNWPSNMNNVNMGMNPSAFQLNPNAPGPVAAAPVYPSPLGGGMVQQSNPGWPPPQQQFSAGDSAPNINDRGSASVTPGPATNPPFEPNSYPTWSS